MINEKEAVEEGQEKAITVTDELACSLSKGSAPLQCTSAEPVLGVRLELRHRRCARIRCSQAKKRHSHVCPPKAGCPSTIKGCQCPRMMMSSVGKRRTAVWMHVT